jgi:ribosomal protein S18 acetylase RimI-like enzyme
MGNIDSTPIASLLGPLRLRPDLAGDETFRFALYCDTRPDLAVLPPPVRDGILRMQFNAQASGYRGQYPGARYDIVELNGEPIGRVVRDYADGSLHLVDIALLSARRGGGGGTALMRAMMDEAAAAGIAMRLMVAADNPGAARLYGRLGFMSQGQQGAHVAMTWRATPA